MTRVAIANMAPYAPPCSDRKGFFSLTPKPSKSATLRVASVRSLTRAIRDLLVERMVGIGDPETPPDLCGVRVEGENAVAPNCSTTLPKPRLETLRLIGVAATADELHPAPQFADGYRGEEGGIARVGELFQKRGDAAVSLVALPRLASDIRVNQNHRARPRPPRPVRNPRRDRPAASTPEPRPSFAAWDAPARRREWPDARPPRFGHAPLRAPSAP